MGRRSIRRLGVPEGWDRQGVGRRFFIFPGMSLKDEDAAELRREMMSQAGRSLVLVPNDRAEMEIANDVAKNLGYATFSADDIEESKKPFIAQKEAVAVIANRYDGIDFPGNECRLLFIEGQPKAMNLQERFLMARMGSSVLFNERVQTRILQAIGRCTRGLEDFSAVVVSGRELPDYLADIKRRKFLHPELQAEIAFGVEQSKGRALNDIIENFETFLDNGKDWEEVNQQIVAARKSATQQPFPVMDDLNSIVSHEVDYQARMWQGDYEEALGAAESVLGGLTAPELRGYRATWHYLAGAAAWYGWKEGVAGLEAKARTHFARAKDAANRISWLVTLARYQIEDVKAAKDNAILLGQIERLEGVLEQLGTVHDRAFAHREKEILTGLASKDNFEHAHKLLGEFLGFEPGKKEADASPDPWWIAGKICLVFEDHAGAEAGSILDATKARQVASHPAWMRANVELAADVQIVPVLVTPVTTAKEGAMPHLNEVALWSIDNFREWAERAVACVRELRKTFSEPGDLVWRAATLERFEAEGLDAPSLVARLSARKAAKYLKSVK
jgi:hypothetical protein